jgi:hypothetical protein
MPREMKVELPPQAIEHLPAQAVEKLPDIVQPEPEFNIIHDDPLIAFEDFVGTDGLDIFVIDANTDANEYRDVLTMNSKSRPLAASELLVHLETENAELRDKAVELALQIQALRHSTRLPHRRS